MRVASPRKSDLEVVTCLIERARSAGASAAELEYLARRRLAESTLHLRRLGAGRWLIGHDDNLLEFTAEGEGMEPLAYVLARPGSRFTPIQLAPGCEPRALLARLKVAARHLERIEPAFAFLAPALTRRGDCVLYRRPPKAPLVSVT